MPNGFLIAAPQSGSGKTVITLGILRALAKRGQSTFPAKAGPDYIDPAFHSLASGVDCVNLDPWAMRPSLISSIVNERSLEDVLVVEAMMGLFDGAADGTGSAADLAEMLKLPVVLVVDCARQSHSIAALVSGFANFRPGLKFAGVILNRVGSDRHETMLRDALANANIPVLGAVRKDDQLVVPSRHLGLVQASENTHMDAFIEHAADCIENQVDLNALLALALTEQVKSRNTEKLAPLGQTIAIAQDVAFSFAYPHLLKGWKEQGAALKFFSPLNDETPPVDCDAIFLPGGYPELHGGKIASSDTFLRGIRKAASSGVTIYGECGGFMVLGNSIVDADTQTHQMAGLLPLVTSFAEKKRHLGYRRISSLADTPFGGQGSCFMAHEFHYSSVVQEDLADGQRLFSAKDASDKSLGDVGLKCGNVFGSYMHIIDGDFGA